MSSTPGQAPIKLRVWQQNLNKSRVAQEDLINSDVHKNYDAMLLQEPFIDAFGNTKSTRNWRVVYPLSWLLDPAPPRAVILVSATLDTNSWAQVHITGTWDLVAIRFTGPLVVLFHTIFTMIA